MTYSIATRPSLYWLVAVVAQLLFLSTVAQAEQASETPAPAPASSVYQRHLDAGIKLYGSGRYEAAIIEFEAAFAAAPNPSPLVNQALSYEHLDAPSHPHPTALGMAIAKLERVLRDFGEGLTEKQRASVRAKLAELKPLVGSVIVTVTPADANVTLGSIEVRARHPVVVRSGSWPLQASLNGYATTQTRVTVTSGQQRRVSLELAPTAGRLTVTTRSNRCYVEIDRQAVKRGGWSGQLPAGSHEIRIVEPGRPLRSMQIVVLAGAHIKVWQASNGYLTTDAPTIVPSGSDPNKSAAPLAAQPTNDDGISGFHFGASSAFLAAAHPGGVQDVFSWQADGAPLGLALGLSGGYRAIDWLGFALTAEYGVTWGDGKVAWLNGSAVDGPADYALQYWRITGGLRVVAPGDGPVRFVGMAATGPLIATIEWSTSDVSRGAYLKNASGVDFAIVFDVGVQFAIRRVTLDVVFANVLQTTRGMNPDGANQSAFDDGIIWFAGPSIRPGYQFFD